MIREYVILSEGYAPYEISEENPDINEIIDKLCEDKNVLDVGLYISEKGKPEVFVKYKNGENSNDSSN